MVILTKSHPYDYNSFCLTYIHISHDLNVAIENKKCKNVKIESFLLLTIIKYIEFENKFLKQSVNLSHDEIILK